MSDPPAPMSHTSRGFVSGIPDGHAQYDRRDHDDPEHAMSIPAPSAGWQRNVWALALSVFIAFVGFQFFSPFLPLYVRELGVSDPAGIALWSGVLAAVTPAVSGLLSPIFGR